MNPIDILNFPTLISFLTSISSIFKKISNDSWVQILCPICDDSTRKSGRLDHGHMYISRYGNYCKCFRCDYSNSLSRMLQKLGYNDHATLSAISRNNTQNFTFYNQKNLNNFADINIKDKIINYHTWFKENHNNLFINYLNYINNRCGNIDPIDFLLKPLIKDDYLLVSMYNFNGALVTSRYITYHKKFRYLIPSSQTKPYYYFQNILDIDTYKNIVICEGAIDLINISNYSQLFNNAFYIAIGGKQFKKILREIISNYLLIGNYNFHIIFDNDGKNYMYKKMMAGCTDTVYTLNQNVNISFYNPPISKDFSELNYLEQL